MRTGSKIIVGVALAGLAAAGGAAFTAGAGLDAGDTTSFIGGKASVAVVGATLDTVNYNYTLAAGEGAPAIVHGVGLIFGEDMTGKTVSLRLNGDTDAPDGQNCVTATPTTHVTCTFDDFDTVDLTTLQVLVTGN